MGNGRYASTDGPSEPPLNRSRSDQPLLAIGTKYEQAIYRITRAWAALLN